MTTTLVLSIVLAVVGIALAITKCKALPHSISSMVWLLEGDTRWVWTIWMWSVAFLLAPPLINALPYSWQALGFFTCASMVFCGAFPLFDTEHEKWHDILGVSAGILSQLCVLLICPWWLFVWVVFAVIALLVIYTDWGNDVFGEHTVFLSELLCGISLYGSILLSCKQM